MEELKNNEVRADVPAEISTWTKINTYNDTKTRVSIPRST